MTAFLVGTSQQIVVYDRASGRYRSSTTGKYTSRSTLLRLVDEEAARLSARMQGHARNLTAGRIDLPAFQRRAAEDLKLSAIRSGILGSGGRSLTTGAQYGSIGRLLRDQYNYLDGFSRDIAAGKLTKSQIIQRASLYGASTRSAFHQSEKIAKGREGFRLAKRSLDSAAQHCPECVLYSTSGQFVPIEQIVPIGSRCTCQSKCRCFLVYRKR